MKKFQLTFFTVVSLTTINAPKLEAAVLVTFDDNASGVITATVTGFIDLGEVLQTQNDRDTPNTVSSASTDTLFTWVEGTPSRDGYVGGVATESRLNTIPDVALTSTFGYSNNALFVPFDTMIGDIYNIPANSFWQWNAENLADIGLGSLSTSTPLTVWQSIRVGADDTVIQFIAVPEPSSSLLMALTGIAWMTRRRR